MLKEQTRVSDFWRATATFSEGSANKTALTACISAMRSSLSNLVGVVLCCVVAMASSQSAATPLPVVESILQSACNNQINNFARFGGFGKNECTDADRKLIIGTATAEAMAETRYVPADDLAPATAWARAKAELDYHGDQFGNKDSGFRGRALASATLVYSVGFIETEMPPATGFDIPLMMEVTIAGTVSFGSRGSGGVVAGSDVNQPGIYDLGRVDATAFPDKDTGLISLDEKKLFQYSLSVGNVGIVGVFAGCEALDNDDGPRLSFCAMFTDPVPIFDQATFDQEMGRDTFNLAEFYSIVLSPLPEQAAAPIPATALLLVVPFLTLAAGFKKVKAVAGRQRVV